MYNIHMYTYVYLYDRVKRRKGEEIFILKLADIKTSTALTSISSM